MYPQRKIIFILLPTTFRGTLDHVGGSREVVPHYLDPTSPSIDEERVRALKEIRRRQRERPN